MGLNNLNEIIYRFKFRQYHYWKIIKNDLFQEPYNQNHYSWCDRSVAKLNVLNEIEKGLLEIQALIQNVDNEPSYQHWKVHVCIVESWGPPHKGLK